MSYRMVLIGDRVRIGQNRQGDFNVEVWPVMFGKDDPEEIFIPFADAEEVAKFILRHS